MKFLVKTHEYSKMFTTAKSDDFYNCIDCCMDTINTLRNVLDVIQEAKAGELDEWSEIDAYEESMIENTTGISWVQQCRFSKYSSINYCYGTLVNRIRAYNEKLKDFLALGIYANDAWRDSLCKLTKNILGIIMYILWFDYGVETTAEECCSSDEIEIDIALSSYCDATPIVTSSFQLSRLAHLLRPERYPNPKRLAQDLESKRFSIEQDPFFFINRKASEFGRTSTPNGHVIAVSPSPSQSECNCGGVKLFQICKGYGAVNQVQALEELVNEHGGVPGLIFISQGSIIEWVSANFKKNEIDFEVIDGEILVNYIYKKYNYFVLPSHINDLENCPEHIRKIINLAMVEIAESKSLILRDSYSYDSLYSELVSDYEKYHADAFIIDHSFALTGGKDGDNGKSNIDGLAKDAREFRKNYPVYCLVLSHPSTPAKDSLAKDKAIEYSSTKGSQNLSTDADDLFVLRDNEVLRKEGMIAIENIKRRNASRITERIILKKMFSVSHFDYDEKYQATATSLSVDADIALNRLESMYSQDDYTL